MKLYLANSLVASKQATPIIHLPLLAQAEGKKWVMGKGQMDNCITGFAVKLLAR